ncbi:MAG TPA: GlsB/YeaQ/YmgE family stress response membrane protein, partial [Thermoanaerobaculia bacterium]|nr:GlsB/YeaQ/YmgE family stress response membrane protein [Thermoanaerobaculia bacterium]
AAVTVWWGAIAWGVCGLVLAVVLRLLPPWRAVSWWLALAAGVVGALVGGVLATLLGFGGLAAFDWRSIATAALAALLALLVLALVRMR